jgi:hypothetical protein
MKKEVVVVEPTTPEEAKKLFLMWMKSNPLIAEHLCKEDILVDYIKGGSGTDLCRYRIFINQD